MFTLFEQIAAAVVAVALSVASLFGGAAPPQRPQNLGITIPIVPAFFETSLASKITSSDTSMTLVSALTKDGTSLSGLYGFVIDEGTSLEEIVEGTASSTAITGMTRGLSVVDGKTSIAGLKKDHRKGASVKITNAPQLTRLSRILNGDETIPNPIKYDASVTSSTLQGDSQYLVSLATLQGIVASGAANGSETLQGLVELATQAECAAGTSSGTGGRLVCPTSLFSSTWTSTTTVPVTNATGTLDSRFINQATTYSWSGLHTFSGGLTSSATTTISGSLIIASSSPTLTPSTTVYIVSATSTNTSYTYTKSANLRYLILKMVGGGGGSGGANADSEAGGGGGGGAYCEVRINASSLNATTSIQVGGAGIAGLATGGTAGGNASSSTFGSFTAGGGAGGHAGTTVDSNAASAGGLVTGCDINIPGQKGEPGHGGLSATFARGGRGGSSQLGHGGVGAGDQGGPAADSGAGFGAGAAGAADEGAADDAGNTGTPGVVIVTEYFL